MTKMQQWSGLTGLAVVVILLAGWFLLVAPKRGEAADLREQTTAQEQRHQQVRTQLAMLRAQDAKLPAQRARLAQIAAKLPGGTALPTLVRSLTDAAARSGADVVSMTPGQPAAVTSASSGSGSGSPAAGSSPTGSAGQLASISVTLQVHGGFFQLESFLHRLETLRRAFLVTGVTLAPGAKLQPSGADAGSGGWDAWTGNLVATVTGRVFMVSNRPTAPAGQPSAAASAAAPARLTPAEPPSDAPRRRLLLLAGLTVVALVAGLAVAVTALGGDDGSELTAPVPRRATPVASPTAGTATAGTPTAGTATPEPRSTARAVTTAPAAPRARVARPVTARDPFRPLVVPAAETGSAVAGSGTSSGGTGTSSGGTGTSSGGTGTSAGGTGTSAGGTGASGASGASATSDPAGASTSAGTLC